MITRRALLEGAGAGAVLAGAGLAFPNTIEALAAGAPLTPGVPAGVAGIAGMETLPGKKPLIRLADRPPNYEAPLEYFRTPITPNDEFFVRYHLAAVPEANDPSIDPKTFKIAVGGDGANGTAELTLDDLKAMPAAEVVAVNQCSGNRRGLSQPHVPGVE
jgi:DMSO/TMAO reductase YedYZ molybdopterin-dependent catalytic subunit